MSTDTVHGTGSADAVQGLQAARPAVLADADDPREVVQVGVLMAGGRLAGRTFDSRADAEAWARPDEGDQVVEFNPLCECGFTS